MATRKNASKPTKKAGINGGPWVQVLGRKPAAASPPRVREAAPTLMMAIEGHSAPIVAAAAAVVGPLDAASVGRQAALIVAARITEELPHVLDTMDRIELRLDRERANNRAEDLKSIEIDIAAGSITVGALNPADVTELIRLAGDLDESIVRSKLLNLTLQAVGQVLDSVVRVKDILKS